jgi:hypothetical protein
MKGYFPHQFIAIAREVALIVEGVDVEPDSLSTSLVHLLIQ